eukprot:gene29642-18281_t
MEPVAEAFDDLAEADSLAEADDLAEDMSAEAAAEKSALSKAEAAKKLDAELKEEVARRRNFAIISHPDAGKTTLTEKLLLFGGAIHEAGEVKARRAAKSATSDWMELEKQRGISISSTALTFAYKNSQVNLLDTPGHQDFSEDTYRTLAAADNAVMLVDGAKGIEAQTKKLFEVARMRNLPIFTVVNKLDRPSLNGFEIIEQLEKEFGLPSYPINWPIGSGDRFCGIYHRPTQKVLIYSRTGAKGSKGETKEYDLDDAELENLIEPDLLEQLHEDVELLEVLGDELDKEAVLRGEVTPMFFTSAMSNFGVEPFLEEFLKMSARPGEAKVRGGPAVAPTSTQFSGLVFGEGKFEKGMKVKVSRTGRVVTLSSPQRLFANERSTVLEGFAGDVIGLTNPGAFAIGDTLCRGAQAQGTFAIGDTLCLLGEGAVQVLYSTDEYRQDPILAAVGNLQYEVVQYRMKSEYNVDTELEPMSYTLAR